MVGKNARKPLSKQSKPITDYFLRSSPSTSSTSQSASSPLTSRRSPRVAASRGDTTVNPARSVSTRSSIAEVVIDVDSCTAMMPQRKSSRLAKVATAAQENGHSSPQTRNASKALNLPSRTSSKRKPMFDSDSEPDQVQTRKHIFKPTPAISRSVSSRVSPPDSTKAEDVSRRHSSLSSFKRRRLSPPLSIAAGSVTGELVPTSQTDEAELTPIYTKAKDTQNIDEWRRRAATRSTESPDPLLLDSLSLMDVDPVEVPDRATPSGDDIPPPSNAIRPVAPLSSSITPPPSSDSASLPPITPTEPEPATSAAGIIAQIKARAHAAVHSSPEPEIREFKEELDDSDDEDLFSAPFVMDRGKKPRVTFSSAKGEKTTRHSPSPLFSDSSESHSPPAPKTRAQRNRTAPPRAPVVLTQVASTSRKASKSNPLDSLLREKRTADKKGKGSEAILNAKLVADESDSEDSNSGVKGSSSEDGGPQYAPQQQDKDLLGEDRFGVVDSILRQDATNEVETRERPKNAGVSFWRTQRLSSGEMEVHIPLTVPQDLGGQGIVQALLNALTRRDYTLASLLLDSGVYATTTVSEQFKVYLLRLALNPHEHQLSASAHHALMQISSADSNTFPFVPFDTLLEIVASLGADLSVCNKVGWKAASNHFSAVDVDTQMVILNRLMHTIALLARKNSLSLQETPDILLLLLLIAQDPNTLPDIRIGTVVALDALSSFVASEQNDTPNFEVLVCNRVLAYASTLQPVNQAYLLSLLGAGTGPARRLASWVANSLIVNRPSISVENYHPLPPLSPIYDSLLRTRRTTTEKPGPFEVHDDTDYVDMGYKIELLSAALYDIEGYIIQEHAHGTPNKGSELFSVLGQTGQEGGLKLVKEALDTLHEKIADTKAAHLDRSRTKAALQTIAIRIYYQSQAASRTIGFNKRQNIQSYFQIRPSS